MKISNKRLWKKREASRILTSRDSSKNTSFMSNKNSYNSQFPSNSNSSPSATWTSLLTSSTNSRNCSSYTCFNNSSTPRRRCSRHLCPSETPSRFQTSPLAATLLPSVLKPPLFQTPTHTALIQHQIWRIKLPTSSHLRLPQSHCPRWTKVLTVLDAHVIY